MQRRARIGVDSAHDSCLSAENSRDGYRTDSVAGNVFIAFVVLVAVRDTLPCAWSVRTPALIPWVAAARVEFVNIAA
jgi:hypothetical protein